MNIFLPSFFPSFLEKKIREDAFLSLSALIRTWCRSRREIFEISRHLCPPPPRGSPQLLCFRPIKMSRKLMIHPPPFTILSRYPLYIFFFFAKYLSWRTRFHGKTVGRENFYYQYHYTATFNYNLLAERRSFFENFSTLSARSFVSEETLPFSLSLSSFRGEESARVALT